MTFGDFITQYDDIAPGAVSLAEEAFTTASDWWVIGADLWMAEDQQAPVPGTWQEAKEAMSNAPSYPCHDEGECTAWLVLNLLQDHAEGAAQEDLRDLLEEAFAEGAYQGWQEALEAQERRRERRD